MEKRIRDSVAEIFAVYLLIVLSDALFATWYVSPPRFTVSTAPVWSSLAPRHMARACLHLLGGVGLVVFARRDATRALKSHPWIASLALLPLLSCVWSIAPSRTAYEACRLLALTIFAAWASTWNLRRRVRVFGATFTILIGASYAAVFAPGAPGVMTSEVIEALEQHQSAPPRTDAPASEDAPTSPNLSAFLAYQRAHAAAPPTSVQGCWRGVFSHKNELAAVVALVLAVLPLLALHRVVTWPTWATAAALCGIALAHTRSTGAGVALLCAWGAFALAHTRSKWLGAGALGLAIAGISLIASYNPTLTGRTFLWNETWHALSHRPWLGYGYGVFWRAAPEAARIDALWPMHPWHAHNSWLDLALDLGVIGVLGLLLAIAMTMRRAPPSPGAWGTLGFVMALSTIERSLHWNNGGWGLLWFATLTTLLGLRSRAGFPEQIA